MIQSKPHHLALTYKNLSAQNLALLAIQAVMCNLMVNQVHQLMMSHEVHTYIALYLHNHSTHITNLILVWSFFWIFRSLWCSGRMALLGFGTMWWLITVGWTEFWKNS